MDQRAEQQLRPAQQNLIEDSPFRQITCTRLPPCIICYVVFFLLFFLFVASWTYGDKLGDPQIYLYPLGQAYRCGFGQAQKFSYAYFYNPAVHSKTVCVQKCPTFNDGILSPVNCYFNYRCKYQTSLSSTYMYNESEIAKIKQYKMIGYETFETTGNLCLPVSSLMHSVFKENSNAIYNRISQQHESVSVVDLFHKFTFIIAIAGGSLMLAIIFHIFLRYTQALKKNIFWPLLVVLLLIQLTTGIVFLYQGGLIKSASYIGYLGLSFVAKQARYIALGVIFIVLFVCFLFVGVLEFLRRRRQDWNNQGNLVQQAMKPFIWKEFLIYFVGVCIYVGHWAVCIYIYLWIRTSPKTAYKHSLYQTRMFTWVQPSTACNFLGNFMIFWAIYCGFVIIGFFKSLIMVYFTTNDLQIYEIVVNLLYDKFGSIAFSGYFCSTIGRVLEFVLWNKKQLNQKTRLNWVFNVIRLFSPAIYIDMRSLDKNYWQHCRTAHLMVWEIVNKDVEFKRKRLMMKMQKDIGTFCKLISSLFSAMLIQLICVFNFKQHTQIFDPLWVLVPGWFVGWGLADLIIYRMENLTRLSDFIEKETVHGQELPRVVPRDDRGNRADD